MEINSVLELIVLIKLKFGCDYSDQLIKICSERNFNCFVSDCLSIPAKTDFFDYLISIAVLHHLSTKVSRLDNGDSNALQK